MSDTTPATPPAATGYNPATDPPPVDVPFAGMATFMGWLFVLGGLALMLWSFFFNVGVEVSSVSGLSSSLGMSDMTSTVANADKMGIRNMMLQSGGFFLVAGSVILSRSKS